jgi:hypothetical protein
MADDDIRMELIRRYLLDQLSRTEKADFQTRLLFEPELRHEVELMRAAQKVLRADAVYGYARGRWLMRWLFVLGILSAVSSGVYLYFQRGGKDAVAPIIKSAPSIHLQPARDTNESPEIPGKKALPIPDTRPSKPVAAVFQPNPALEHYRAGNGNILRGQNAALTLDQPRPNAYFPTADRQTLLPIAGSAANGKLPLRVHLFSNNPADYTRFAPKWSTDLALSPTPDNNGRFTFRTEANVTVPAGLYYLLLENSESGAVLYVTTIRVTPAK